MMTTIEGVFMRETCRLIGNFQLPHLETGHVYKRQLIQCSDTFQLLADSHLLQLEGKSHPFLANSSKIDFLTNTILSN